MLLSSCKKDLPTDNTELINNTKRHKSTVTSESIQDYLRIVQLGTIDLFKNDSIAVLLNDIANTTSALSEDGDYYVYLDDLSLAFETRLGLDLQEEMEASIANYGSSNDLELFQNNGFHFSSGDFEFNIRYFIPSKNTQYSSLSLATHPDFGIWVFNVDSNENGYEFPGFSWNSTYQDYESTTFNSLNFDDNAIVLVSTSAYNTATSEDIDMKFIESCGRCSDPNHVKCCHQGHACKCDSPPITDINDFIDETF